MAVTELFANNASASVTAGGNNAPSPGTSQTWTVASSAQFPAISTGVSQIRIVDPAVPGEVMMVTNISGTTWTVTRGAEGTTAAHTPTFTVYNIVSAAFLESLPVAVTAIPTTTLGDIMYEDATPAPARLPGNTTSATQILTQTGTGSASAAPAWVTLNTSSGILPLTTLGDILYYDGGTLARLAGNTSAIRKVLTQTGTGSVSAAPAWAEVMPWTIASGAVTLANSTAVTNIAAGTVPANDPAAGAVYRITAWGLASTTSAPTLTFTSAWGGTTLVTSSAITMGSSVSNQQFSLTADIAFVSTTSVAAYLKAEYSIAALGWNVPTLGVKQAAPAAVTTTSATAYALTAKWSAASASNTLTAYYTVQRVA